LTASRPSDLVRPFGFRDCFVVENGNLWNMAQFVLTAFS